MRYEKLRPNLYGTHLKYGKINLNPPHSFSCFFIVQHTDDEDLIEEQARQLLLAGCRNFDFFGKKESLWHLGFDDVDIMLNQDLTPESVALTSGWSTLDDFVEALNLEISVKPTIPHDTYLLYDDRAIYEEVLRRLDLQIDSIEEIEVHGTVELWTDNLILRRYHPEDAEQLYQRFGTDPEMVRYSGWNPYATLKMAQETVHRFIESYSDIHAYSWVMDVDDVVVGTIGAYDYAHDQIEVGFSVDRGWQGRGFATEALRKVLAYLTENEGIPCVTAWCAAENIGSRRVLEKAGMELVHIEKDGLSVGDKTYDKLSFVYKAEHQQVVYKK